MIEAIEKLITIFTDYLATLSITNQTLLQTILLKKLNLCLILVSQFIQHFNIKLLHKPGKKNIIIDALSYLPSQNYELKAENLDTLNIVGAFNRELTSNKDNPDILAVDLSLIYTITLAEISPKFKRKLLKEYKIDIRWKKILDLLENKNKLKNMVLLYKKNNKGLFFSFNIIGLNTMKKLYILRNLVKNVFNLAHDTMGHNNIKTLINQLSTLAINKIIKLTKDYIRHCLDCLKIKIR
jgi:hypothetical protein